jgi:hypothetical protein
LRAAAPRGSAAIDHHLAVSPLNPAASSALRERLLAAGRYDAEYGASLSNHLPMALVALARLGASDERLAAFAARYAQRLHAAPAAEPWPAGDAWHAHLGRPRAWPIYRSLCREWMAHEGPREVLQQMLPRLAAGIGAAAFHGPIRVAYALAANHADELADALAYWACRWFPLGAPSAAGSVADPTPLLAQLDFAGELPDAGLISQRMASAAAHPRFAPVADRLHVDLRGTLPRLAQRAAERYAVGADFTVLHLVTSAHAMQVLLPWFDEDAARREALGHYARAWLAAWATRPPHDAPLAPLAVLPWPEVVARAVESDDDHVVKLVDSCRELEREFGGASWRVAAARAVG